MTVIAEKAASALSRMGIDFDAVYNAHVPLMIGIAVDRFHISHSDAQTLAHQIFLVYFMKPEDVKEPRAWFVGAISVPKRKQDMGVTGNVASHRLVGGDPFLSFGQRLFPLLNL